MNNLNYVALADEYNRLFPQYHFTEDVLKGWQSLGVNVNNIHDVERLLTNDTYERAKKFKEQYDSRFGVDELAQEIQLKEYQKGQTLTNDELIKEFKKKSEKAVSSLGEAEGNTILGNIKDYYEKRPLTENDWLDSLRSGFRAGYDYGSKSGKMQPEEVRYHEGYAEGIYERAPEIYWKGRDEYGKTGFALGRVGADITGHGTKKLLWNLHPADIAWTNASYALRKSGATKGYANLGGFLTQEALGLGSGNYNPLNLVEGGRPSGYAAISPDPEDPRKSTNPALDLLVHRGLLGRTGRLLPWEQFSQERPDVSYESYNNYQNWITNREPDPLGEATLGLARFYSDDEMGNELRLLGYRVTPLGLAAAVATPFIFNTKEMKSLIDPLIRSTY